MKSILPGTIVALVVLSICQHFNARDLRQQIKDAKAETKLQNHTGFVYGIKTGYTMGVLRAQHTDVSYVTSMYITENYAAISNYFDNAFAANGMTNH